MTDLLQVSDLSVSFETRRGTVNAVDRLSFTLAPGETLGVVGESGCGKTVTALSLLKLLPEPQATVSDESRVEFDGENILTLEGENLRRIRGSEISMIFQDPMSSLNPVLTVGEQIAETVRAHEDVSQSESRNRAIEMLRLTGVPEAEDRHDDYPHQMSGGMLQRVMIGMALCCQPSILIADEPTTALDVTVQAQILELLMKLREEFNMAILLIAHDLGVVAELSHRVMVMYGGRAVETGTTKQIFSNPSHPYTRGLLEATPRIDQPVMEIDPIPGSVPPGTDWPTGCRFHPRCRDVLNECPIEEPRAVELAEFHTVSCLLHRSGRQK